MARTWAVFVLAWVLLSPPAHSLLIEDAPERQLFLGYPASVPELTVKIVRRKESYGIYVFRASAKTGRLLTRSSFVGLVEGSLGSVDFDQRAASFFREWFGRTGKLPAAIRIGNHYRYQMEELGWVLEITVRNPLKSCYITPGNLISQLYGESAQSKRLEQLSRALDLQTYALRDRLDLRSLL